MLAERHALVERSSDKCKVPPQLFSVMHEVDSKAGALWHVPLLLCCAVLPLVVVVGAA